MESGCYNEAIMGNTTQKRKIMGQMSVCLLYKGKAFYGELSSFRLFMDVKENYEYKKHSAGLEGSGASPSSGYSKNLLQACF